MAIKDSMKKMFESERIAHYCKENDARASEDMLSKRTFSDAKGVVEDSCLYCFCWRFRVFGGFMSITPFTTSLQFVF